MKYSLKKTFRSLNGQPFWTHVEGDPLTLRAALAAACEGPAVNEKGEPRLLLPGDITKRVGIGIKLAAEADEIELSADHVKYLISTLPAALPPAAVIAVVTYLESAEA